jgi:hypothetical protein
MTTTVETAVKKQVPAFYIFAQGEDGKNQRIGAAFAHRTGNGFNVVIGETRYVAFPPKAKSEQQQEKAA